MNDEDDLIEIPQCRVPLCTNPQGVFKNWPICIECMINTIRRFKLYMPGKTEEEIADFICFNIDRLINLEQDAIDRYGADYDRDTLDDE